jgi:hypothetical protein
MNILAQAATSATKALRTSLRSLMDATLKQIQIRPFIEL